MAKLSEGVDSSVNVLQQPSAVERVVMTDLDFMRLALQAAWQGVERGELPFGACLVRDGRVVATAYNSTKSVRDTTAHAEVQALREAGRRLQLLDVIGSAMYATCEPCPMCFGACLLAKVSKIVYACRIEDAEKIGIRQIPIPAAVLSQMSQSNLVLVPDLLRDEGIKLFEGWQRKKLKPVR